ncbi:unnamed protein product [Spirodela intermedia]|uniref:C3H1-type domain-containing protein n=1 Tax=Spirodela intermedia TaxID=51605 RepID=A0A7I8KYP8_SPIIN|nr:unnamed protein product [Spirodela intermedia]
MQQGNEFINGRVEPPPVSSPMSLLTPDRHSSSPPRSVGNGGEFSNICASLFAPKESTLFTPQIQYQSSTPISITTSSLSCDDDSEEAAATEHCLGLARLTLQYQEMLGRYELCLSHLEEAAEEAEALRLENSNLRMANAELARRLTIISPYGQSSRSTGGLSEVYPGLPLSLLNDFQRLDLNISPTTAEWSPIHDCQNDNILTRRAQVQDHRTTLPKSISIRSKGYMKLAASNRNGRNRFSDPAMLGPQKVYVPLEEDENSSSDGNKQEKEAATLEFDAYAQGMFKTELCNKWQEAGSCPYGEHCQFAHGIAELRPVIRHPRYKTEICRMILSGGTCPYGHRCHFRHALSPQDNFLSASTN